MGLLDLVKPILDLPHRHRRVWRTRGRVHIELREVDARGAPGFGDTLRVVLEEHPGVSWAEVLDRPGRVVVSYDDQGVTVDELIGLIEQAERTEQVHDRPFGVDRPDHPADPEPIVRAVVALGADVGGLALAGLGRLRGWQVVPLEVDAAAVLAMLQGAPKLRERVEKQVTVPVAELGLAVANGIMAGLAQGPTGPVVDILHRLILLTEAEARRNAWMEREPELCDKPSDHPVRTLVPEPREVALRRGPIEQYADRAWIASLGGFGAALALTRNLERASAALLAGLPKAAQLGREAYAAHIGRLLAGREVVILDPKALRRLDRLDVLVVEADLLMSHTPELGRVEVLTEIEPTEARHRASAIFDPTDPLATQERDSWVLRADERDDHLVLLHQGEAQARFEVRLALDDEGRALLAAARRADLRVVVSTEGDPERLHDLDADELVGGAGVLAREVRRLQEDGSGVLVVATGSSPGLEVADFGVGLRAHGGSPAWDAHLVCDDDLTDAWLVVEACGVAREVSGQSANLAFFGASAGVFLTFGGLLPGTSQRVTTAINIAAVLAIANGTRAGVDVGNRPRPVHEEMVPWHAVEVDDALGMLGTTRQGLPSGEVRTRYVPPPAPLPEPVVFGRAVLDELLNPLTPVLVVGAGLSLAVGSVSDAALVGAVVGFNAVLGGWQQYRTERAVARLSQRERQQVTVLRDGGSRRVYGDELVQGDVLALEAGDAVPADCRILSAQNLQTDESSLTGESLPVAKHSRPTNSAVVAERTSMLYEGTSVAAGEARAVVVATGEETEARRGIATAADRPPSTGVEERLAALTRATTPISVGGGLGVVGIGLLRGMPLFQTAGAGVSLAVAAVPEGLPLLATVAQMSSARRLSARGALVRNPRAIEALGRVDVLCADKTGTLTEGRIRVHVVSEGNDELGLDELTETHRRVLAAALRATPVPDPDSKLPHPTDRALIHAAEDTGVHAATGVDGWERSHELPFEPGRAYHATLGFHDGRGLLTVKGAPEAVIPRSTRWRTDQEEIEMGEREREELLAHMEQLAVSGLRVLAVGERPTSDGGEPPGEDDVADLTFLGFLGLRDPARPTAVEAVEGMRTAGVRVVMITGDHPSTAEGIAAELGMMSHEAVVTGPEIDGLGDDELATRLESATVCARVTPSHKVRIVKVLQDRGHAVAMTGDGANDAPAIRLADVGVALGTRATTAARDAADLVVVDDRIETIVAAIAEGRTMWASVRDAVSVLVGGNIGEITFTVLGSLVNGAPPLNARQLLLVNLMTDVAPAMAIAVRPPHDATVQSLLREGPDRSLGEALNRAIAVRAASTALGASGAWVTARMTGTPTRARTVALISLVGTQLGQTLLAGGRSPGVVAAGVGSFVVLAGIVQTPGVSQLFGCRPLGPLGWATATGWAAGATAGSQLLARSIDGLPPSWLARAGMAAPLELEPGAVRETTGD